MIAIDTYARHDDTHMAEWINGVVERLTLTALWA
jgi:hypothetical protein